MSRVARRVTIAFLEEKVRQATADGESIRTVVGKDLKVRFDFENFDCQPYVGSDPLIGYCTLGNGLTFLGCRAGGDWEYPVWFCVYWDGKRLRAYVPTEGNPYNRTKKQAYGSNLEADRKDFLKWNPDGYCPVDDGPDWEPADMVDRDYSRILEDIAERIEVKDQ